MKTNLEISIKSASLAPPNINQHVTEFRKEVAFRIKTLNILNIQVFYCQLLWLLNSFELEPDQYIGWFLLAFTC